MSCPLCKSPQHRFVQSEPACRKPSSLNGLMVSVVTCEKCEFMYVKRDFDPEIVDAYYAVTSSGFPLSMENFGWWHHSVEGSDRQILGVMERALGKTGKLLDLGCGYGAFMYDASARGWSTTGVEICAPLTNFVRTQLGFPVLEGSLESIQLELESFDAISLIDVLEHMYDPLQTLRICSKQLRAGGIVVIKSPHGRMQLLKERTKRRLGLGNGDIANIGHLNHFSPHTMSVAFKEAGLSPVTVVPARSFPPGIRGVGFRPKLWLHYVTIEMSNNVISEVHVVSGRNFGLNLVGVARKPS